MPYGDGTGWDETLPLDSVKISDVPKAIRETNLAHTIRAEKEHNEYAASSAGGEHKQGSAKAYYQSSFPTLRPNGSSSLSSADNGRIFIDSDNGGMWYWVNTGWVELKVATNGHLTDGVITKEKVADDFTLGIMPEAILKESQAAGTDAGGFTSGSWVTRDINTEESDVGAIVTAPSSGEFDLEDGNYRIQAKAAAYQVDQHQIRLKNVDDTVHYYGTSEAAPNGVAVVTWSTLDVILTVSSGPKTFRLEHRCVTTKASTGRGIACGAAFGGAETYAQVRIRKLL